MDFVEQGREFRKRRSRSHGRFVEIDGVGMADDVAVAGDNDRFGGMGSTP